MTTLSEISRLITAKSPFILLKTFDAYPEKMARYEIITLERLESFSAANVVGAAVINHLDKCAPDEVSMVDFGMVVATGQLVRKRADRFGEIFDYNGCLRKYHEFACKYRIEHETNN